MLIQLTHSEKASLTFTKGKECTFQLEDYGGEIGHVTSEFSTEVATAASTYSLRNKEKLEGTGRIATRITEGFENTPLRWGPSVFQQ